MKSSRAPDEFLGGVIGDLNSRRGHVQERIRAATPRSDRNGPARNMFGYINTLRSMTQDARNTRCQFDTIAGSASIADEVKAKYA